jgi:hypothetical protein
MIRRTIVPTRTVVLCVVVFCFICFSTSPLFAQWVSTNIPNLPNIGTGTGVYDFAVQDSQLVTCGYSGVYLLNGNHTDWSYRWINNPTVYNQPMDIEASGSYIAAAALYDGVQLSYDAGISWTRSYDPRWGSGDHLYVTLERGGGIWYSNNRGASWMSWGHGLPTGYISALLVSGSTVYAGTYGYMGPGHGVFRQTIGDSLWTPAGLSGGPGGIRSLAVSGPYLFAGTDGNGVFRSSNNGTSWESVNLGLTPNDSPLDKMSVWSFASIGNTMFVGTTVDPPIRQWPGVFYSTDYGAHWASANPGGEADNYGNVQVRALAVFGSDLWATISTVPYRRPLAEFGAPQNSVCSVNSGWNILSIPRIPVDSSATALFPGAVSGTIYGYSNGSYSNPTVCRPGEGYWALYADSTSNTIVGNAVTGWSVSMPTGNSWALIGSLTQTASPSAIVTQPSGAMVPGTLYGWNGTNYVTPTILEPGKGYWVLVNQACVVSMSTQ